MRHAVALLLVFSVSGSARLHAGVRHDGRGGERLSGIRLLTEESLEEAIACGTSGAECAVQPYRLCGSNSRFSVRLATPYSRVAFSIYEAERTHRKPRPPTRGGANGWGMGLFVSPADDPQTAEAIERAFVRRGGEVIPPLTSTLAPVVVDRGQSGKVQLSKAFFAFPIDVFRPTSDITIVLVGASGETTCTLDRRELSALR